MTKYQAKIILAFAKNNMRINETAEELYTTDGNVQYHLRKIKAQEGRNPKNFFDLCFLVGMAQEATTRKHGEKDKGCW